MMIEVGVRTTVTMSDETLVELMRFSRANTRTEAVNRAVEEWVRLRKTQELRSLRGKLSFEEDIEVIRRADMGELDDLESCGAG
jgi:Arc/MetJ family transcription regulator